LLAVARRTGKVKPEVGSQRGRRQRGDSDLTANGRIVEPGGAGSLKIYLPVVIKNLKNQML
jgi:hypothetical protein